MLGMIVSQIRGKTEYNRICSIEMNWWNYE